VYVISLTKPGKYPIFASNAPFMKGQIIVTDARGNEPAPATSATAASSPGY